MSCPSIDCLPPGCLITAAGTVAETAERLAANKSQVIILIYELDALGHGDLC